MKSLLICLLTCITLTAFAGDKDKGIKEEDVPEKVMEAFKAKFPEAANAEWEKEEEGETMEYEVEFVMDGKNMEATFTESGDWLETETEISTADLSGALLLVLEAKYPGKKVKDDKAEHIELADGTILYELTFTGEDGEEEVTFTETGSVYEEEGETEDED